MVFTETGRSGSHNGYSWVDSSAKGLMQFSNESRMSSTRLKSGSSICHRDSLVMLSRVLRCSFRQRYHLVVLDLVLVQYVDRWVRRDVQMIAYWFNVRIGSNAYIAAV